jgi:predicted small metal-binding protein
MTLKFSCANVGVVCKKSVTADTEAELVDKIAAHAAEAHGVTVLTDTLAGYAKSTVEVVDDKR